MEAIPRDEKHEKHLSEVWESSVISWFGKERLGNKQSMFRGVYICCRNHENQQLSLYTPGTCPRSLDGIQAFGYTLKLKGLSPPAGTQASTSNKHHRLYHQTWPGYFQDSQFGERNQMNAMVYMYINIYVYGPASLTTYFMGSIRFYKPTCRTGGTWR